ncbi:MAG: helix-turn-helix domain-containing protein [Candidatus Velamenicoccus archaeovorus]
MRDSDLPRRAVIVAYALATWMNAEGSCWPSLAAIAKAARVSRDTTIRGIRDLEEAGWIRREVGGSPSGGHRSTTRYLSQIVRPVAPLDLSQDGARPVADHATRPVADHATRSFQEVPKEGAPASSPLRGSPATEDDPEPSVDDPAWADWSARRRKARRA